MKETVSDGLAFPESEGLRLKSGMGLYYDIRNTRGGVHGYDGTSLA